MSTTDDTTELSQQIYAALKTVRDPDIGRPLTELGMVKSIDIAPDHSIHVTIYLTISGCPMKTQIGQAVHDAIADLPNTGPIQVSFDVMSDQQREQLRQHLQGNHPQPVIPFAQPGSLTRVYAIASGKGGVGKSTITANLGVGLAQRGLSVGILDADIYGHSIPRMMGISALPTKVDSMILPPQAYGVKVISIAMFTQNNTPVVWRGPMLHRALQQFLTDVYWGDLDVLLLDLPPGTGDVAISLAQLLPSAEIIVVTTPQMAAAEVAERAGAIALQTRQHVLGVIENMAGLTLPDGSTLELFGQGGGQQVADRLTQALGKQVELLAQIPLDPHIVPAGDHGHPIIKDSSSPAGQQFAHLADRLTNRRHSLVGRSLTLNT